MFGQLPSLILLILGFGFVIFFHELGHFLAAKWVGIRVEQFAVGFGHALFSWRKGLGLTAGSSGRKYEELAAAGQAQGIGETEYRLNWIPLGGYVKMLGQDDLNPHAQQEDPRAYNKKSIGARMFVVSAGVIMNIILAAIGFMVVFLMGFRVQPPVVGSVLPDSAATRTVRADGTIAPLEVGDRVLMFDGKWQHDFTKITLNVALSGDGPVPIYVRRVNGNEERLWVRPERIEGDPNSFLMMGIGPPMELRGVDPERQQLDEEIFGSDNPLQFVSRDYLTIKPGDTITAVNGEPVDVKEYHKFHRAVQQSNGKPIQLTVRDMDGKVRQETLTPRFATPLGPTPLDFAGMLPRAMVDQVNTNSSARGKLLPGDVILAMTFTADQATVLNPSVTEVRSRLEKAGQTGQPVDFRVLRGDQELDVKGLVPNVHIGRGVYGLSIALAIDDRHAVVADTLDTSVANAAGVPEGSTIRAVNGQAVQTWFDVRRTMMEAKVGEPLKLAVATPTGEKTIDLPFGKEQHAELAAMNYATVLTAPTPMLHDLVEPRKTSNPLIAAGWGITETRDFVLQFYLTLHRMFTGSVSYKNMMGPVGIFNAGRHFAYKGHDWLIWFLAMISANLAVVNFLPIPIVDGGLFAFLIVEKIQGRPLSAKMQSIAQVVGLAIILSVFLLVTYQDIARLLM